MVTGQVMQKDLFLKLMVQLLVQVSEDHKQS